MIMMLRPGALTILLVSLVLLNTASAETESLFQQQSKRKTTTATEADAAFGTNPVRRVVNMLQAMHKKVQEEGEAEKVLFDKFLCYCASNGGELTDAIEAAKTSIPQLEAKIKSGEAQKAQLEEDLARHRSDREAAKQAIATATAIREKEAAAYAKESGEMGANLESLASAITAIENGMAGAFLETETGRSLFRGLRSPSFGGAVALGDTDRETVSAFLDLARKAGRAGDGSAAGYAPQSGEIVGILKQLKDSMTEELGEIGTTEEEAKKAFAELEGAKTKEIDAATAAIEEKARRNGEIAVEVVMAKNELEDTVKSLSEDEQFKLNLDKSCEEKKKEWAERQQTRAEELEAIWETINILTGDGGMKLLTQTLANTGGAAAMLVQVTAQEKTAGKRALRILSGVERTFRNPKLDLVTLALREKGVSFDKVLQMIDEMVATLAQEQKDDDEKRAYCNTELDKSDDERKESERSISDLQVRIADTKEGIQTLTDEVTALTKGIQDLDMSVATATKTRKQENSVYVKLISDNNAAVEIIGFAKNRLNQFYNPKLAKDMPTKPPAPAGLLQVAKKGKEGKTSTTGTAAKQHVATTTHPASPHASKKDNHAALNSWLSFAQVDEHIDAVAASSHHLAEKEHQTEAVLAVLKKNLGTRAVAAAKSKTKRAEPPPPPETFGDYGKKDEESNGVIAMMTMLQTDLEKEMSEAVAEERDAQDDYETLMADSQEKRAQDSKSLTDKENTKAALTADLVAAEGNLESGKEDLGALQEYISNLHGDCDFLLENYDLRKTARAEESDGLKKAKAVLSGADYGGSLLQTEIAEQEVSAAFEAAFPKKKKNSFLA